MHKKVKYFYHSLITLLQHVYLLLQYYILNFTIKYCNVNGTQWHKSNSGSTASGNTFVYALIQWTDTCPNMRCNQHLFKFKWSCKLLSKLLSALIKTDKIIIIMIKQAVQNFYKLKTSKVLSVNQLLAALNTETMPHILTSFLTLSTEHLFI